MLIRFLTAEVLKLRRSLVMLLCLAAPALVAIIAVLIGLKTGKSVPLLNYAQTGAAFWAFAMLPLSLTALSVLMAQMEHGPRLWDHLLALPGARRRLFLAKALVMIALDAAMTLLLLGFLLVGAWLMPLFKPVTGSFEVATIATLLTKMFLASTLMAVIQLWAALRFRSFVPPLAIGILGTFISVAAAATREGAYFPWLMPLHMLSTDPAMASLALQIGGLGGLAVLLAMLIDLGRRDAV
ncbi:MAG: ABC transporter permease [Sphingomonas bacterium]|nr:ABC transporter permease [Sphingomonas bacterium]